MTLVLALAMPDYALLATDTRVRVRSLDGRSASLFDAPIVGIEHRLKLRRLPWAWFAGAGQSEWTERLGAALAALGRDLNPSRIRAALGAEADVAMSQLEREWPEVAAHVRQHQRLWIVCGNGDAGFLQLCTDWSGRDLWSDLPIGRATCSGPPEIAPDALQPLLNAYQRSVCGTPNLADVLRHTADFAAAVAARCGPCGSVSELLEVGVLRREADGSVVQDYYPPSRSVAEWNPAHAALADGKYALKASDTAGKETDDDLWVAITKTVKVGTVAAPGTITKTLRIPHGELVPTDQSVNPAYFQIGYMRSSNLGSSLAIGSVVMPKGVTITKASARLYRAGGGDTALVTFYKIADDGTSTTLATLTHDAASGWQTKTATLSQLVGDETYTIVVEVDPASVNTDARFNWFELEYSVPSFDKGI